MPQFSGGPFRKRTWFRQYLPWFIINLGIADKGDDCEKENGKHEWYNIDDKTSGCYHCYIEKSGRLWEKDI